MWQGKLSEGWGLEREVTDTHRRIHQGEGCEERFREGRSKVILWQVGMAALTFTPQLKAKRPAKGLTHYSFRPKYKKHKLQRYLMKLI